LLISSIQYGTLNDFQEAAGITKQLIRVEFRKQGNNIVLERAHSVGLLEGCAYEFRSLVESFSCNVIFNHILFWNYFFQV